MSRPTVKPRPEAHMDVILFEVFMRNIHLIVMVVVEVAVVHLQTFSYFSFSPFADTELIMIQLISMMALSQPP